MGALGASQQSLNGQRCADSTLINRTAPVLLKHSLLIHLYHKNSLKKLKEYIIDKSRIYIAS